MEVAGFVAMGYNRIQRRKREMKRGLERMIDRMRNHD